MPRLAVHVASSAYLVRNAKSHDIRVIQNDAKFSEVRKYFSLHSEESNLIRAKVGSWILPQKTIMGAFLFGHGVYDNNVVIMFRGTDISFRGINDVLSDINIGLRPSHNHKSVHAGFQRVFESFKDQLETRIREIITNNPSTRFHIIGHSLGGAVAQLTASWIKHKFGVSTSLYTYGAPRVGLEGYAQSTRLIDQTYRCTHNADPVPMVPLWPFMHAIGDEYQLDSSDGISISAHGISEESIPGYLNTSNYEKWQQIGKRKISQNKHVILKENEAHRVSANRYWADRIADAIVTLLKKMGYGSLIAAQSLIVGGLTIYDWIARIMVRVSETTSRFVDEVRGILSHMARFVGRAIKLPAELTFQFIRKLFNEMVKRLYSVARDAVRLISN